MFDKDQRAHGQGCHAEGAQGDQQGLVIEEGNEGAADDEKNPNTAFFQSR